jgi:adenylylsulfate kinase
MTITPQAFAIWVTGLPASGKTAIARVLKNRLATSGFQIEVLESDVVRQVLTPEPTYSPEERAIFYRALAFCGARLAAHGVPVIFDATANRQVYRDLARSLILRFIEVAVVCPLDICRQRDYKGTYQKGLAKQSATVPGLQEPYEAPRSAEVEVDTAVLTPGQAADKVLDLLRERGYLQAVRTDLKA